MARKLRPRPYLRKIQERCVLDSVNGTSVIVPVQNRDYLEAALPDALLTPIRANFGDIRRGGWSVGGLS